MKKKWLLGLCNAAAIVLIAASVLVLLVVVLTPQGQVPRILGYSVLRVTTGSMEPEIPVNSMILVRRTDPGAIREGDIITFFSREPGLEGALNTHRVQSIAQRDGSLYFTTKGDANALEDQAPVTSEALVGKVVFVSAAMGAVLRLLTNPLVFVPLILLPLLGMLVMNAVRTARLAAKLARQEEEEAVCQILEAAKNRQMSDGEREE